jgi:hypothetical protein
MEKRVVSEAMQEAIADRQIVALVFCTHDLDAEFFEQEVLPVFLGNDLKHTRRTRQAQLDYVIRERSIPIDVFYEQSALTIDGSARLGWNRHPMHRDAGVFHPKVVLALCEDDNGAESLVVSIASANLTQSGWWRNVECAEVLRLVSGERHGYARGLARLLDGLAARRWRLGDSPAAAVLRIREFVRTLSGYANTRLAGRLVPQLLPGDQDLLAAIDGLVGQRVTDSHLEVISPFFDGDAREVADRIDAWTETFQPRTFKIALPARDGTSTIAEEIYDVVDEKDGVTWAKLPRGVMRSADGEEARERSVHAKVYRFWRGYPDPLELVVIGSHNFTGAALSGRGNWEVSVVIEPEDRYLRAWLEDAADRPGAFQMPDDDLGDEENADLPYVPLSIVFDWRTRTATARWRGKHPQPVTLLRAGREVCRIELATSDRLELDANAVKALEDVLRTSALLLCRRADGGEAPILVEELNHDFKPDVLEGLGLTAAEIFALWSIPGMAERLRRVASLRGEVEADEDDIELADLSTTPSSMFERFAGVFQAFSSLRTRVDRAMKEKARRRAGLAVYSEHFDSPVSVLRIMRDQSDDDLAHQYVTWGCARLLDRYVVDHYPRLAEEFATGRAQLLTELRYATVIRKQLIECSDDPQMGEFLEWFDDNFDDEVGKR